MLRTPDTALPLVAENDRAIGRRVRILRILTLVTLDEFSSMTGLPLSYLDKVESGHECPSIGHVTLMARALDVPAYVLLIGSHRSYPSSRRPAAAVGVPRRKK